MSEAVHGAVERRVECMPLEEVSIKGLQRPVRVWRVLGLRATVAEGAAQPFVGRRTELRQFEGALAGCTETAAGQTVLVRGEAGIGKSRLLAEFRALAERAGFACHLALVLDFGVGLGQDAVRTIVSSLLNVDANADEAARRAAVDAALDGGLAHDDQRVFLNELLGVSQPTELRAMYDAMDDAARRRGEHEAVAAVVGALSRRQPQLIQIEDIQWADAPVLAHLAALAAAVAGCPALLVLSSRIESDPLDQAWRAASRDCPLLTIDLAPLREDEAMAFAGEYIDASNRLAQECIKRAEGNPIFLEQLLRSAREHEEEGVQASIQSLILARMDRLPAGEKKAAQAATVIGRRFALETLRFVLDEPNYDCRALVEHHLVRPEGDDYLFDQALIREGIYGSLLKAARRTLHGRAAQWFAERDAVLCAEHLDRADDPAAPSAYLKAAQAQADEYRYERAIALVDRGLALAQRNGETFGLTRLRAELLRRIGRPAESIEAYRAALGLTVDDNERCAAWIGIAAGVRLSGGYDDGIEALARAEEIALRAQNHRALSQIHFYRGDLYFAHADVDGCLDQQQHAVRHAEQADDAEWRARALSGLGDAHYARGSMKSALDCYLQCLSLCSEHGFGRIEVAALYIAANIRRYMNEFEAACQEIGAAVEMAGKVGNLRAEMYARMLEGEFLIERGECARAEATLERAFSLAESMGNRRFMAYVMNHRARCLLGRHRPAEALALLAEAIAISRETGVTFIGPRILGTTDAGARHDALSEGEEVVRAGCFAHNVMWFYRDAMDASLAGGAWDEAERYAGALEDYTRPEPLPWTDFFIARGRALAAHGRGRRDQETMAALSRLRDEATSVGYVAALPGLEAALGAAGT
jgi:tetratricopeptide (TPR) repeat protein